MENACGLNLEKSSRDAALCLGLLHQPCPGSRVLGPQQGLLPTTSPQRQGPRVPARARADEKPLSPDHAFVGPEDGQDGRAAAPKGLGARFTFIEKAPPLTHY